MSERNFGRLVVWLVAAAFLALVVAVGAVAWIQLRTEEHRAWVTHTLEVDRDIMALAAASERAEAGRRGYLLSGAPLSRSVFVEASREVPARLDRLQRLTRDNPRQVGRIEALRSFYAAQRAAQQRTVALADRGLRAQAAGAYGAETGARNTTRIRALLAQMADEEETLLQARAARLERTVVIFYTVLAVAAALLLVVAVLVIAVVVRYTRDLAASRDQLRGLNENLELAVADRTTELQRANEEIQRFAYIVSHDLRSPLVNVMGFTAELDTARKHIAAHFEAAAEDDPEIANTDAALAAREDLPEAIGFIRTSTQKMDRLINAILTLSRQGRRTLAPERVDMDALVQSIADTLQHRVEEAGAEIVIEGELPDIQTDRLAVEQIFSNLIENAVKYLAPGRPGLVTVRGETEGKRVLYEIQDNGRGIDPRDHERVFDLFRRSGSQDQPGEGIGLAHVRALAYRLGGLISCESALDRGATFRLSLPRKFEIGEGVSQ